jgi:hypothetical protein
MKLGKFKSSSISEQSYRLILGILAKYNLGNIGGGSKLSEE